MVARCKSPRLQSHFRLVKTFAKNWKSAVPQKGLSRLFSRPVEQGKLQREDAGASPVDVGLWFSKKAPTRKVQLQSAAARIATSKLRYEEPSPDRVQLHMKEFVGDLFTLPASVGGTRSCALLDSGAQVNR